MNEVFEVPGPNYEWEMEGYFLSLSLVCYTFNPPKRVIVDFYSHKYSDLLWIDHGDHRDCIFISSLLEYLAESGGYFSRKEVVFIVSGLLKRGLLSKEMKREIVLKIGEMCTF